MTNEEKALIRFIKASGRNRVVKAGNQIDVYKRPGVTTERFYTDSAFAGSRQSIENLKQYSKGAKLIRKALGNWLKEIWGAELNRRLLLLMKTIHEKKADGNLDIEQAIDDQHNIVCFDLNPKVPIRLALKQEIGEDFDEPGAKIVRTHVHQNVPFWVQKIIFETATVTVNLFDETNKVLNLFGIRARRDLVFDC